MAFGIGPAIVPAEALTGDVVTKVIWPRIGDQPRVIDAGAATALLPAPREVSGDASADAVAAVDDTGDVQSSADGAPTAAAGSPDVDGAGLATQLRSERLAANGGFGHPHAATGCGFCRRAVAAYR